MNTLVIIGIVAVLIAVWCLFLRDVNPIVGEWGTHIHTITINTQSEGVTVQHTVMALPLPEVKYAQNPLNPNTYVGAKSGDILMYDEKTDTIKFIKDGVAESRIIKRYQKN